MNFAIYLYTCEFPKPSNYCDEPKADNAGFDCLCAAPAGVFCGVANTWSGTLAAAKTKCDGNTECKFLHDWKADGNNWRACRKISSPGDGKAAIKSKSSSTCPARNAAPTPAVAPTGKGVFDSIDGNGDQGISRGELQKAIDAKVIEGAATPTVKPPAIASTATTNAPTVAPPAFDSVDGNGDHQISRGEFQKAIDAGKIIGRAATPTV